MNSKFLKITVLIGFNVLMFSLSSPVTAQTEQCPNRGGIRRSTFPMICRGPMKIETGEPFYLDNPRIPYTDGHDILFRFTPANIAAGETGEFLSPGTCSWVNRAPRGKELDMNEAVIRFKFRRAREGSKGETFQNTVVMNAITNCNFNSNCRIKVCARANGRSQYWWESQYVDIIPIIDTSQ